MRDIELVSFDLCPYVQRAAIALAEKGVPFRRTDIDLARKPEWFVAISPQGKVPLLRVDGTVLFESAAIVEYLDETHGPALHPADPLTRARHRGWMEFGSTVLNDIWEFYTAPDAETFERRRALLRSRFERVEAELATRSGDGPWFAGIAFSLVDCVFAPVFRYWEVFDAIGDFGILGGLPHVQAWRTALQARPSVREAVVPDYADRLRDFLRSRGSHLARRMDEAVAA